MKSFLERKEDVHAAHRAHLKSSFLLFRDHVGPIAADISLSVPGYTDHSLTHCDSLWETASLLLPEDYPINPAEAFVLGGAFLIHDLGMGLSAYPGGLREIIESTAWKDLLTGLFDDRSSDIQASIVEDCEKNATWDGISKAEAKQGLTIFLRSRHAQQAGNILSQTWDVSNGQPEYLLPDTQLRHFYGEVIGKIAKSHWSDVSRLPQELPGILGPIPGFPPEWTVNATKLACVLRLADAIHIDARRANPLQTPHRNPQGASLAHWQFQERLLTPQLEDQRLVFTSSEAFGVEISDAWWLAYDTVKMIDSELRRVDNLCADLHLPRLAAHAAAGAESPERFAAFVGTQGWEPVDARPYIGDQNLVIKSLGGEALYGSMQTDGLVPVRELLANAMDATRAYRMAFPETAARAVQVSLSRSSECDTFLIRDFGVGMSADDVVTKLCNFGVSGWRDEATRTALPGLLSSGYRTTGQFGIGFFSVFMAADRVRVITRHVEAAKAETFVLDFKNGLDERPILRPGTRSEQLLEPGTIVELSLKERVESNLGILSRTALNVAPDNTLLCGIIRALALTSDQSIDVRSIGETYFVNAISGDQWLTDTGRDLFDHLNPLVRKHNPSFLRARSTFDALVRPIEDTTGRVVGRIAVDVIGRTADATYWMTTRRSYSGGLESPRSVHGVVGVLEGNPSGAARSAINLQISLEAFQSWFKAQVTALNELEIEPVVLFSASALGVNLGVVGDELPLAFSTEGFLSRSALVQFLAGCNEIFVFTEPPLEYEIDGTLLRMFMPETSDALAIVGPNMLIVEEGSYGLSALATRPNDMPAPEVKDPVSADEYLFAWWERIYHQPLAEVMRCASEAWRMPLLEVARIVEGLSERGNGDDFRVEVDRFGGGVVKVDAFRIGKAIVTEDDD
ncbi:hypothetical protein E3T55_03785 [Cryobacterium frigoriphilum]|uniref:HD-CE domain-containing protein n=1 Tax=Cryobacterium frigoriphilum TaxID=1259150 RepID=A0A4R9A9V6_9MICO|nr:ATP-binding protein [Cryobacterium frigoriphilum]TFD54548.1 hypothetical protein E3T55_03785 [Cryobacterium frigoriphilum]